MFKLLTLCEARHLEAGVHAICRWVQVPDRPDNTTGYDDPVAAAQTIELPKHKLPIRSMVKVVVSWLLVVCEQVVHVTYSHQQHITSQHNIVQFVMCTRLLSADNTVAPLAGASADIDRNDTKECPHQVVVPAVQGDQLQQQRHPMVATLSDEGAGSPQSR